MKLATLPADNSKQRNGQLIVVSSDNRWAVKPTGIASTLLEALENWKQAAPKLHALSKDLNKGSATAAFAFEMQNCLAPLPNAPGFYDGSAFLSHVVRARRSRGDQMPESARKTPLMYQGVSDNLLPYHVPLDLMNIEY